MSERQHRAVFYSCHHMDTVLCATEHEWLELVRLATATLCPLCELARLAEHVFHHPHHHNRVTGGVIARIGDCMLPIEPGSSPQFQVTPTFDQPSGGTTLAAQASWAVTGTSGATATINSDDPTGNTVTVAIPEGAAIPFSDTLTWTYTNTDGSTATASTPLVDSTQPPPPAANVTGGTIAQIV